MRSWLWSPFALMFALRRLSLHDAVANYRLYHKLHIRGWQKAARKLETVNRLLTGADISASAIIGEGLKLPHPSGVVIGGLCIIGRNCTIYQQATLGYDASGDPCDGQPCIGDGVLVGAGAKLLGPITIGNGVRIGANAVVISDIPDNTIAVGIPARVKARSHSAFLE